MSGQEAAAGSASVGRATRAGVVWSNAAFLLTRALGFIAVLILARLLAPEDFGVVAGVLVFLGVLELGSDLGMRASVVYEQERGITPRVQTAFSLGLAIAAVLTLGGVLLAPLLADFFRVPAATGLFRLAVFNILLTGLGNVHDALLLREMQMRRRTISEVVRGLARAVVSIGLAVVGAGASSLVWGMLAGTAAWAVALWALTGFIPSFSLDRRIARSMASYGLGASALDALAAVTTRLDAVVIARVLGEGALGLYSIAFRVPELAVQSIAWNISLVVFPALSKQRTIDRGGLERSTLELVRYQALYALPVAAGIGVLSTPLIIVLFGQKWASAAGVMAAVAAMTAIAAVVHPLGDLLKAVGRQRILVVANLVMIPAMIVAIVAAASAGIVWVAWARVASVGLFALVLTASTAWAAGVRPRGVAIALLPGLAAAGGVALGAGLVRLAWPEPAIGPLVVGALAGGATGTAVLRLLAPATFRGAVSQVRRLLAERARGPAATQAG